MAEIARRAGVGMATVYRNFPGRRELLEALYTDEVNAICEAVETVEGETPGAVLMAWLHRLFAFSTSKRHSLPSCSRLTEVCDGASSTGSMTEPGRGS
ncbi:MAG TPA: TetR/AcrR family transcriptional regulator [Acidimicrobiales bacterium]|nr:TetR/AcrR family transcriptional regulator [Acidimicrobiales bacterium]